VESPEKQKQLSRPFHRPLEISLRRDSHIPTARLRPGWKSAKPKTGFSLSHAWLATITPVRSFKKQTTKKGSRPLRGLVILNFQDHLALETQPAFRIILGLENANVAADKSASAMFLRLRSSVCRNLDERRGFRRLAGLAMDGRQSDGGADPGSVRREALSRDTRKIDEN
jgi:hypothetical protein